MWVQGSKNELSPPEIARNKDAVEVLRVWAEPGSPQQLVLQTMWKDPGAWGLMLADIARHASRAYGAEGYGEQKAFDRIMELFVAEIRSPTDTPQGGVLPE